jgi:hypothetical protein
MARDLKRVLVSRRASALEVEIFMRKGNVVQEILAQAKATRSNLVVIIAGFSVWCSDRSRKRSCAWRHARS